MYRERVSPSDGDTAATGEDKFDATALKGKDRRHVYSTSTAETPPIRHCTSQVARWHDRLSFAYPWLALLLPLSVLVFRLPAPHEESRPAVRVPFFGLLVSPPCLVSVSTSPIDW